MRTLVYFLFYQHEQPTFSTIERKMNILFTNVFGFEFISQMENCLLDFDDWSEEIFTDKEFSKIATDGRQNKTKKAAIILYKIFNSNSVSISEKTNILHIDDEPRGREVTSSLYNLQQPTKNLICQSISKSEVNLIYQPTWFIILTQKNF